MPKKPDLKKVINKLQVDLMDAYDEYLAAHKEIALYEGQLIDSIGVDKVNELIHNVSEKFIAIYPVLNFIQIQHQFSTNVMNGYADFVENLKKQGAKEERMTDKPKVEA